jgi:hypothetical protein
MKRKLHGELLSRPYKGTKTGTERKTGMEESAVI